MKIIIMKKERNHNGNLFRGLPFGTAMGPNFRLMKGCELLMPGLEVYTRKHNQLFGLAKNGGGFLVGIFLLSTIPKITVML